MPRNYIRKRPDLAPITEQQIAKAKELIAQGKSKRAAANAIGISDTCLRKRLKLNKAATSMGRFKPTFDEAQEAEFVTHCKNMDARFFGLTINDMRRLAYEFASANEIDNRFDKSAKMAGRDWVECFLKRHPELVIRQSAPTSLARAMGFNKTQVERFYINLKNLYLKHKFKPSRVYNVDETGISTVPKKMPKVVTTRGKKVVAKLVSADRGVTVTAICCMNASGHFIPPAFIYPRKRPRDDLLDGGPSENIMQVSDSGFVNTELFVNWLHHFKYFVRPSKEDPVLLILDNHSSHISLEAVEFARANNIVMLTLPPHGSHKLQPLDRCFFSPLKVKYAIECEKYMSQHPGRGITQYQVARLFNEAYKKVATLGNAESGFRVTGIFPFNDDLFDESDFAPSMVTDQVPEAVNAHNSIAGPSNQHQPAVVDHQANDRSNQNVDDLAEPMRNDDDTAISGPSHQHQPMLVDELLNQNMDEEAEQSNIQQIDQTQNINTEPEDRPGNNFHENVDNQNAEHSMQRNISPHIQSEITFDAIPEDYSTPSPSVIDAMQSTVENLPDHSLNHIQEQLNDRSSTTAEGPFLAVSSTPTCAENVCSTSTKPTQPAKEGKVSIEHISPLPRMKEKRKIGGRASMKSEIITNSPFKQQLEEKKQQAKEKVKKPKLALNASIKKTAPKKATLKATKVIRKGVSSKNKKRLSSKEKEYYCPLCQEKYTEPPTEEWIKCMACEEWWHEQCTSYERGVFVCDNCK